MSAYLLFMKISEDRVHFILYFKVGNQNYLKISEGDLLQITKIA